jgi:predicted Zn-dependent peptidase
MSSRLFQVVREKHGLAYSIHSSFHLFGDSGALVISGGLDRRHNARAVGLVLGELDRLRKRPVGPRELKRAKDYAIGHLRMSMESTTTQMMWLGENTLSHGRFIPPEETIDTLERVTADDVQRLANQVLARSRLSLALLAPDLSAGEKRAIRDAVRSF